MLGGGAATIGSHQALHVLIVKYADAISRKCPAARADSQSVLAERSLLSMLSLVECADGVALVHVTSH